ncbi:MAG: hypothetical protein KDD38_09740, partial [Bdellovibrionales bacterium]|nr:hypothetical protein [Bdellovibrionales bacterium]
MTAKILIFLVFIYAAPSFAGDTNRISANCSATAKNYVLRGSWSDTHPGARLWDVDRVLREYKSSAPINSCLDEVWAHVSAEADEYWTYIGGKWGCLSADGEPLPQASGQCGNDRLNQVKKNLGYVDSIQLVAVSRIEQDCKCEVGAKAPVADLANEIGKAMAAAPDQPTDSPEVELDDATLAAIFASSGQCENVPESKRRTDVNKSGVVAKTGSCLLGLAKGIFGSLKSTITGIWDLAKGALGVVTGGPEYRALRAAFVGSVGPAMASFFVSPSQAIAKLANNIAQGFSQVLNNSLNEFKSHWSCLSDEARSELVCKSIAFAGTEVALIFAGGAGLVSAIGKSGKLANLTEKVRKGMSTALGEMGMLARKGGGLFKNLAAVTKLSGAKWVTTTKDGVELAIVGGKSFVKKGAEIYEVTSKEVSERIAKLVGSAQRAKQAAEAKFASSLERRKAALASRTKVTTNTVRETSAVSSKAPDLKISAKDSSRLVKSAEVRAGSVSGAKKLIAERGLAPKETFSVGGVKYHLSDPIEFQGRKAFVAVVENGNSKSIQVFYQSGSQGTFRNLPGVLSDGNEIRWFDKAMGEHGLEVPIDLDRIMNQRAQSIKSVVELTDADVQKLVPSAE